MIACEGLFGKEASFFMKRMAKKLADKWRRPYSSAVGRCIRGARTSLDFITHKFEWEDGAGLQFFSALE